MASDDEFWICSSCSWVNKNTESSCKACGNNAPPGTVIVAPPPPASASQAYSVPYTYQPAVAASVLPSADVPEELWVCKCTWVNKNTVSSCKACGSSPPPGTVIVAPTPAEPTGSSYTYAATPVQAAVVAPTAATPSSGYNYTYETPTAPTAPTAVYDAPVATGGASSGYNYTYGSATPTAPVQTSARPEHARPTTSSTTGPTSNTATARPGHKQPVPVQQQTDDFASGFGSHTTGSQAPCSSKTSTAYTTTPVRPPVPPPSTVSSQPQVFKIKEKFWGFGDDFSIKDSSDRSVYKVKGKAFSWGDKLSFQDANGRELAYISQEMFSFQPRYQIYRNGTVVAKVVKEWTWMTKRFTLDVPGPNDYSIDGSFWEHDFTFKRKGRQVARVDKRMFAFTDTYGVEIVAGEDVISILCACIIIDQVLHDD